MNIITIVGLTLGSMVPRAECQPPEDPRGTNYVIEHDDPLLGDVDANEPLCRAHRRGPMMADSEMPFTIRQKIYCTDPSVNSNCEDNFSFTYNFLRQVLATEREKVGPCPHLAVTIHGDSKRLPYPLMAALGRYYDKNLNGYCIMLMDWSKHANEPVNVITVGRQLAAILYLMVYNSIVEPKNIHLIGHSLGPHVAHYASIWLNELLSRNDIKMRSKIGRITGLDPRAKDSFIIPGTHLAAEDATFVDVIHTTSVRKLRKLPFNTRPPPSCGEGAWFDIGSVDFYPNGGTALQPGCEFLDNGLDGRRWTPYNVQLWEESIACSHESAIDFFIESLIKPDASARDAFERVFPSFSCSQVHDPPTALKCFAESPRNASNASSMGMQAIYFAGRGRQSLDACLKNRCLP